MTSPGPSRPKRRYAASPSCPKRIPMRKRTCGRPTTNCATCSTAVRRSSTRSSSKARPLFPGLVSDNIERLLGVPPAEAASFEWWRDNLHPEDRDRVISAVTREFARDGCSIEYRLRRRDGTYRWVEDNNRVLRDAVGQATEVVGMWTDITERKTARKRGAAAGTATEFVFSQGQRLDLRCWTRTCDISRSTIRWPR